MWRGDSIQLSIDSGSIAAAGGRVNSFYELGLTLLPTGEVATYAWDGNFDWASAAVHGEKTEEGYDLRVSIPWTNLALDPEHLPESIGINLVVNDVGTDGQRRFVEWTPGTAEKKDRTVFARAVIAEGASQIITSLRVDRSSYEDEQSIEGQFVEYSRSAIPAEFLQITGVGRPNFRRTWPGLDLEKMSADTTQTVHFILPPNAVENEGAYKLIAETLRPPSALAQPLAVASFQRLNTQTKIVSETASFRRGLSEAHSQAAEKPEMAEDPFKKLDFESEG